MPFLLIMATIEQLDKAREKSRQSSRTGKRGKGKKTIVLEKVREEWAREQLKDWGKLTAVQRREALKPENFAERKYVMDQMMGKAKEKVEVERSGGEPIQLDVTIRKAIGKIYGDEAALE